MTIAEKVFWNYGFDVNGGQYRGKCCIYCRCTEKNRKWNGRCYSYQSYIVRMVVSYYWNFIYIINIYISFWRVENMGLFVNNEHDIGQCRVIIIIIIIVIITFLLLWNRELRF